MTEKFPLYLAKLFRYVKWALLILVLAYFAQFLWVASHKGQSKMGAAFETIAHEALRKQQSNLSQMRITGANSNPNYPYSECPFWNFERTWGRCIGVGLGVRDYSLDQHLFIEQEVINLAEQLTKPCPLLSTLMFPNAEQLARDLECGSLLNSFKLEIQVVVGTVVDERGPPSKSHRWLMKNQKLIKTYHFHGEL